jgi:adenosylcobinamide-phosphate synthase
VLALGQRGLCRGGSVRLLLSGAALTLAALALAAGAGELVAAAAAVLGPSGLVLEALVLKTTISPRGLVTAARAVAVPLRRGDLAAARARLGVHLVSRATADLDAGQVASGAIESVAENLTDAVVAPVAFFLLLGVPGALAYRALNTADTMLGYREGPLEYFGKLAARLDDLANLVPARLAALAIVVAAGPRAPSAWRGMRRDHARTASPNAGWTMSAIAGALSVTLEKPGAYRFEHGRPPAAPDVDRGIHLFWWSVGISLILMLSIRAIF